MDKKQQACNHLRLCLKGRLQAWDESCKAEDLLGVDIDSNSHSVDSLLVVLYEGDIDQLSDEEILEAFEVDI